jgi:hypothetical protein
MDAETPPKPDSNRWCWECQRRRLVCDCARPVCNKCHGAGLVCPGYEDKKPLTWLAPGRVLSRTRKPRGRTPSNQQPTVKKSAAVLKRPVPTTSPILDVAGQRRLEIVPVVKLRTDMCDLVDAVQYCKITLLKSISHD